MTIRDSEQTAVTQDHVLADRHRDKMRKQLRWIIALLALLIVATGMLAVAAFQANAKLAEANDLALEANALALAEDELRLEDARTVSDAMRWIIQDMDDNCFDDSHVSGAMQQNGCFLQYIAALLAAEFRR